MLQTIGTVYEMLYFDTCYGAHFVVKTLEISYLTGTPNIVWKIFKNTVKLQEIQKTAKNQYKGQIKIKK